LILFPTSNETTIACAQADLSLPRDGFERLRRVCHSAHHATADLRRAAICPRCLQKKAANNLISSFRDATLLHCPTARVFARHKTKIGHELSRIAEPLEVTDLCNEADGDGLSNTAQCLESVHERRQHPGRKKLTELRFDLRPARERLVHRVQVCLQGVLLGGVFERLVGQPRAVHFAPVLSGHGEVPAVLQQVALDVLPRASDIKSRALASTHEVPNRLMCLVGHPNKGKFASTEQPSQLDRIPMIVLYPFARFAQHAGRGRHFAFVAFRRQVPRDTVPTRPSLVYELHMLVFRLELSKQPVDGLGGIRNAAKEPDLPITPSLGDRHCNRRLVHVESNERVEFSHDQISGVVSQSASAGAGRCSFTRGDATKGRAADGHITYDIHIAQASPIAAEALDRLGRLYAIETEIRGRPANERAAARQARAGPELEALHAWMHATLMVLSQKSELAAAIRYALSRWAALVRCRDDGRVEMDNNAAERALRAVALGRKNWLFAGSDDGGERAANIYSLLGTAKLNDLNPEGYLRYVLERIADHPINEIDRLLPWNVAAQSPQLRLAA
jgi:hypothetical protein